MKRLPKPKEGEKFDWYALPVSQRVAIANDLGKKAANEMNKALEKTRKLLAPYGYTMRMDLHFCELPKDQENQAVGQKS